VYRLDKETNIAYYYTVLYCTIERRIEYMYTIQLFCTTLLHYYSTLLYSIYYPLRLLYSTLHCTLLYSSPLQYTTLLYSLLFYFLLSTLLFSSLLVRSTLLLPLSTVPYSYTYRTVTYSDTTIYMLCYTLLHVDGLLCSLPLEGWWWMGALGGTQ